MSQPIVIVGANTGVVGVRREIRDLATDPKQFSLYIRALAQIADPSEDNSPYGFRRLGGIHGAPYESWPGDPGEQPVGAYDPTNPNQQWLGYCYHAAVLFPPWHRVLLLLVEQAISQAAQAIATSDGQQAPAEAQDWAKAAQELRLPFWDWTDPSTSASGLPDVFQQPTLTITVAGGNTQQVTNPLEHYTFGSALPDNFVDDSQDGSYWSTWPRTYRWPTNDPTNPQEQYAELDDGLTGQSAPQGTEPSQWLRDKVGHFFSLQPSYPDNTTYPSLWDLFSNVSYYPSSGSDAPARPSENLPDGVSYASMSALEDPHNMVHVDLGGSGHMSNPDYAGFDPIFYLHHANVDRLYAYWEVVYPDYWVGSGWYDSNGNQQAFAGQGTLVQQQTDSLTETTGLAPFRKSVDAYWTSDDVRFLYDGKGVKPKYYTYPDITNGAGTVSVSQSIPAAQRADAIAVLQQQFGFNPTGDLARVKKPLWGSLFRNLSVVPNARALPVTPKQVENYRHFVLFVELVEHAFNGSYKVQVYVGNTNRAIGAVATFARKDPSRCPGCVSRDERGVRIGGVITIPIAIISELLEAGGHAHPNVTDDEIINHLKQSLSAKIFTAGRRLIAETSTTPALASDHILPADVTPRLTIHSSAAAHLKHQQATHGAHYLYDWKDHGTLLTERWIDRRPAH